MQLFYLTELRLLKTSGVTGFGFGSITVVLSSKFPKSGRLQNKGCSWYHVLQRLKAIVIIPPTKHCLNKWYLVLGILAVFHFLAHFSLLMSFSNIDFYSWNQISPINSCIDWFRQIGHVNKKICIPWLIDKYKKQRPIRYKKKLFLWRIYTYLIVLSIGIHFYMKKLNPIVDCWSWSQIM